MSTVCFRISTVWLMRSGAGGGGWWWFRVASAALTPTPGQLRPSQVTWPGGGLDPRFRERGSGLDLEGALKSVTQQGAWGPLTLSTQQFPLLVEVGQEEAVDQCGLPQA